MPKPSFFLNRIFLRNDVVRNISWRSQLESFMVNAWQQRGLTAILLLPLSWLYGGVVRYRAWRYKALLCQHKTTLDPAQSTALLPCVWVVGNVTVGGTGKSPFVVYLAKYCADLGVSVAVISRGYGGTGPYPMHVMAETDWRVAGDEAVMMATQLPSSVPVVVAPQRSASLRYIQTHFPHVQLVISDDGLQHYKMPRMVEWVLLDAQRGLGNRWLLPAGPLRQPVDFYNQTPAPESAPLRFWAINVATQQSIHASLQPLHRPLYLHLQVNGFVPMNALARQKAELLKESSGQLKAIAGLGNPQRFFNTLRSLSVQAQEFVFADHYAYQLHDLLHVIASSPTDGLVMTHKDAVKCMAFVNTLPVPVWYLAVEAYLDKHAQPMIHKALQYCDLPCHVRDNT